MNKTWILVPVLAQVLLTAVVWVWMYVARIREMISEGINAQALATTQQARQRLQQSVSPAENFGNLFEIPVLFYVAVLILYSTGWADYFYLVLAVAFVLLRHIHSIIHITYNRVMHRFSIYVLSTLVLWAMWARLGVDMLQDLQCFV